VKLRSLALRISFAGALLYTVVHPLAAFADSTEEVAQEAEEETDHEEAHHGPLTFREVVAGHESLQFWGAVVNFILLLWVIRKLAKQPLANYLTERREKIERGIQEAAVARSKAEAVFNEYTERMKTLDQELAKLRADIAKGAAADRAQIVADAEETAKRVKAETEQLVARQAEQLEADIRREVVQAAIDAAERAVREAATADDQRRLADAFARELAKVKVEKRA
jgi:F-type H+-transporting ATPase subunit b